MILLKSTKIEATIVEQQLSEFFYYIFFVILLDSRHIFMVVWK